MINVRAAILNQDENKCSYEILLGLRSDVEMEANPWST